jgi:vacuolar fusion protein MON1
MMMMVLCPLTEVNWVEDKMIRWRSRRKHFFILSSAGKPIYSRYGDDGIISGYMGVIQAIISFFEDNNDTLKYSHPR